MKIVDVGAGPPVVVIPGVQGRWEWHRVGIEALARRCRVITFSLADEPTAGARWDERDVFASYVEQVGEALDQAEVGAATICGVSYGGLIASAFAARHPERVSGLVLVSALPPTWRADARVRFYLRAPRLLSPLFCVASLRLFPEFVAAHGLARGLGSGLRHAWTALTHLFSPTRMARRARVMPFEPAFAAALGHVRVQTLIVTGEEGLDRVVPVRLTARYKAVWPHAESVCLERTGHLGMVTRPEAFASLVGEFASRCDASPERRRVG